MNKLKEKYDAERKERMQIESQYILDSQTDKVCAGQKFQAAMQQHYFKLLNRASGAKFKTGEKR